MCPDRARSHVSREHLWWLPDTERKRVWGHLGQTGSRYLHSWPASASSCFANPGGSYCHLADIRHLRCPPSSKRTHYRPRRRRADPKLLVFDVGHHHRPPSNVLPVGGEDTVGRIGLVVVLHIHLAPKLYLFHVAGTTDGSCLFACLGKDREENSRKNRYYRDNDKQLY